MLETVVTKVTPAKVASLVYKLEPQQHKANRGTVAVDQLIDELLKEEGHDLTTRAQYEMPLKQAILRAVEQIPNMEFISGG